MYVLWGGVLPLYWRSIRGIGPLETLAHRILWGAVLLVITTRRQAMAQALHFAFAQPKRRTYAIFGALVIASNWLIYIWGVRQSRMTEASLGYYIGPLMSMMLGHWVLKEPLRPLQRLAGLCAAGGVAHLVWWRGAAPVFGLALAGTFSLYGLLRKLSGLKGMQGFIVETVLLSPCAAGLLAVLHLQGKTQFFAAPLATQLLLMGSGILGSLPLILFGAAAQHLPLTTLGILQFLAPTLGLIMAIWAFGEPMNATLWITFGGIWAALSLWICDSLACASRLGAIVPRK